MVSRFEQSEADRKKKEAMKKAQKARKDYLKRHQKGENIAYAGVSSAMSALSAFWLDATFSNALADTRIGEELVNGFPLDEYQAMASLATGVGVGFLGHCYDRNPYLGILYGIAGSAVGHLIHNGLESLI
ncbi:MAG: hypothetical protein CMH64_04510 [Nanoarchaeota archaeon]|nr:hypothetical protein [Nanoarchaeota archaeon]|tara:strand:- start:8041 stop:8430 length:390 start_codon:yes stop_codon:yes gene_type:complete